MYPVPSTKTHDPTFEADRPPKDVSLEMSQKRGCVVMSPKKRLIPMSFSVQRRRRMMMMMDIQRVRMNYNHSHLAPWISAGASFIKLLRLPLQNEFLMQGNPHRRNGLTTMKVVQLGQLMIVNLTISREMEKILHEFLQCSVLTSVYVALLNWWQRVLVQVLASKEL